jgi:hypothetical protein
VEVIANSIEESLTAVEMERGSATVNGGPMEDDVPRREIAPRTQLLALDYSLGQVPRDSVVLSIPLSRAKSCPDPRLIAMAATALFPLCTAEQDIVTLSRQHQI